MWISLIVAVLSYLLSARGTASERRNALLTAAAAGGVTYGITEYTDWGQENLAPLNDSISDVVKGKATTATTDASTTPPTADGSVNSGFWDTLESWGPSGVAAAAGAVGVATGALDVKSLLPWVIGGLLIFAVIK